MAAPPRETNNVFSKRIAILTATFNLLLVVFSGLLWKVSKEANETNVATQRASLSAAGPAIIKLPNPDGKTLKGVNFIFSLINSGTTPVKTGVAEANIQIGHSTPQKGTNFDDLPQSERTIFVLGAKGGIQLPPMFVPASELDAAEQGKTHIFAWGWTTYRDIFPDSQMHLTEFCTDISTVAFTKPDHTDFTGDLNFGTPSCPTHNCFDNECEDYAVRTK